MTDNNKPLFLFVGKSASGKTTIADMLEKDGYKQVKSYTTRPKRYAEEDCHTFITKEEYLNLKNIVASTYYNNNYYCTTSYQLQDADIYVVDPAGVSELISNKSLIDRDMYVLYFDASPIKRMMRMFKRGDGFKKIISRIIDDESNDWISSLFDTCMTMGGFVVVPIYRINANMDIQDTYDKVKSYIYGLQA